LPTGTEGPLSLPVTVRSHSALRGGRSQRGPCLATAT
jgi:hypothetical protein